jgi:hypothetical protein
MRRRLVRIIIAGCTGLCWPTAGASGPGFSLEPDDVLDACLLQQCTASDPRLPCTASVSLGCPLPKGDKTA